MTRRPRIIGVHLDVAPARGDDTSDAGGCQIDRGMFRPVLDDTGYALAAVVDRPSPTELTLEVAPPPRGPDARDRTAHLDAHDLGAHLQRLTGSSAAFCRLAGLDAGAVRVTSDRTLELRLSAGAGLLEAALRSERFAPRRDRGGRLAYTGAFAPVAPLRLRSTSGVEVRFHVTSSAERAAELFERGELALSCPTAFDLAARCAGDPRLRRCPTAVHAIAIFNPDAMGPLADHAVRMAIWERAVAGRSPWEGASWLRPDPRAPAAGGPIAGAAARATVTFGDYWPNRLLAERLAAALADQGVGQVAQRGVSLAQLSAALAEVEFDVLLWLVVGLLPGEDGVLLWMAEMALHLAGDEAQAVIVRRFRDHQEAGTGETRARLRDALLRLMPFAPLCGFEAGYLAAPWLPERPLVDGSVYPIEVLAEPGA